MVVATTYKIREGLVHAERNGGMTVKRVEVGGGKFLLVKIGDWEVHPYKGAAYTVSHQDFGRAFEEIEYAIGTIGELKHQASGGKPKTQGEKNYLNTRGDQRPVKCVCVTRGRIRVVNASCGIHGEDPDTMRCLEVTGAGALGGTIKCGELIVEGICRCGLRYRQVWDSNNARGWGITKPITKLVEELADRHDVASGGRSERVESIEAIVLEHSPKEMQTRWPAINPEPFDPNCTCEGGYDNDCLVHGQAATSDAIVDNPEAEVVDMTPAGHLVFVNGIEERRRDNSDWPNWMNKAWNDVSTELNENSERTTDMMPVEKNSKPPET